MLVAAAIFQLASGLANSAQWYPWSFSFRTTHYAMAWVAIGALVVHIAVKLPIIRGTLTRDVDDTTYDRPTATRPGAMSRRGLLRTTWLAAGVAVLATAGSTVPLLRKVSVFGVRSGDGPQGIPINKSAEAADVTATATSPAYRLELVNGDQLRVADPRGAARRCRSRPRPCRSRASRAGARAATWTGVRVRDLLDLVGAPAGTRRAW